MRKTDLNAPMFAQLHYDIMATALPLLRRHHYLVWEDVVIRAKRRPHRRDIDWQKIRDNLEKEIGQRLVSVNAKQFSKDYYEDRFTLTKEVREFLARQNGNRVAGVCFAGWDPDFTRRRIVAQQHVGDGFHNSARVLEANIEQVPGEAAQPLALKDE